MNTRDLAKIDLNLLISLQVLLEERHVSRAAERLHITQPAMSKTLSRLRELFGDPLFTRSSHGMRPTPRALELGGGLGRVLGDISRLVAGEQFDPAQSRAEIVLALSEYIGVSLLPALARKLQSLAPGLHIRAVTRVENQLEQLALGTLDFAIHIEQSQYGNDYRVQRLGGSPPAIMVRDAHPLTLEPVTAQRLNNFPLIRLYIADREQQEIELRSDSLSPLLTERGSLEISHLLTALEVLRTTDYYMPAPAYILQNEEASRGITALHMPGAEEFTIEYALVAHQRTANSPLHNWLWEEITCTIRELRMPLQHKVRRRVAAGSADSGDR